MNARMLVIAGSVVALAAAAAPVAKTVPIKPSKKPTAQNHHPKSKAAAKIHVAAKPTKQVAKNVLTEPVPPRVLCICIVNPPFTPAPPISREEWERRWDQEMIDHGLEPIYGTTGTATTVQAAAQ